MWRVLLGLALLGGAAPARAQEAAPVSQDATSASTTGALRLGVYYDTDHTQVIRSLASVASTSGDWSLTGSGAVDIVSSASVDVRSSPGLSAVDMVTSASGRSSTSGGRMSDRRLLGTGGAGWSDGAGHTTNLAASYATEADYTSVSGRMNGSYDLFDRTLTLLGGLAFTDNWIGTVLDPAFRRNMHELGWSVGAAQVTSQRDAIRLRYDGSDAEGYQASPYRNVRFGDWTTMKGPNQQITFKDTIGAAAGLPENVPGSRVRHAAVLELVKALDEGIGLHGELRVGRDSWKVKSETAAVDLRVAESFWRMQLGYRFYTQSAAAFFQDKYLLDPSMYTYYSSDKELGRELGHMLNFDISAVVGPSHGPGDTRLLLDLRIAVLRYDYPGFLLLSSRTSYFIESGLTWEL
jgi:hypothetical protein